MYREQETSYYDLLEVHPNSGPTEIYEAYQRARETYSPQSPAIYSMFTEQEARELLKLIDEAYSTLSNAQRKREYDLKLGLARKDSPLLETVSPHVRPIPEKEEVPNQYSPIPPAPKDTSSFVEERKVGRAEEGWSGVVKVYRKQEDASGQTGRTRFGSFKVDSNFENDIRTVEECDGSFLQKIREYKGVNMADLSEAMKISKSILKALEDNDLDRLPVQVFTRGIVVQYCRMLNLDETKVVDAYMTYFKAHKK